MSEYTFTTRTFEMADTGIGKAMGHEDDKAFLKYMEAERAKLPPEVQEAVNAARAEFRRRLLYG